MISVQLVVLSISIACMLSAQRFAAKTDCALVIMWADVLACDSRLL